MLLAIVSKYCCVISMAELSLCICIYVPDILSKLTFPISVIFFILFEILISFGEFNEVTGFNVLGIYQTYRNILTLHRC